MIRKIAGVRAAQLGLPDIRAPDEVVIADAATGRQRATRLLVMLIEVSLAMRLHRLRTSRVPWSSCAGDGAGLRASAPRPSRQQCLPSTSYLGRHFSGGSQDAVPVVRPPRRGPRRAGKLLWRFGHASHAASMMSAMPMPASSPFWGRSRRASDRDPGKAARSADAPAAARIGRLGARCRGSGAGRSPDLLDPCRRPPARDPSGPSSGTPDPPVAGGIRRLRVPLLPICGPRGGRVRSGADRLLHPLPEIHDQHGSLTDFGLRYFLPRRSGTNKGVDFSRP